MQNGVIILAAGKGNKMNPYNSIRSKTTLKIAGKPLIRFNIEKVLALGCKEIVVVSSDEYVRGIKESLLGLPNIEFVIADSNLGTADSLEVGVSKLSNKSNFIVLYGDTIISTVDLKMLCNVKSPAILLKKLNETSRNWIGASIEDGYLSVVGAHYRGNTITHQFAGFSFNEHILDYVKSAPDYFPDVKVGVSVPRERYLEAGIYHSLMGNCKIQALECTQYFFDVDKPWHMLEANHFMVQHLCKKLEKNNLSDGAHISSKATLKGFVQLGQNSYIGDHVLVEGNLIVGDNVIIDNGAIFKGSCIVGDHTKIRNYCFINDGVSIGDHCILDHCSEFLGGIIMDKVYLYHYCEFYGAIGSYSDIGAATVCGTLRFDDSERPHVINGRREVPLTFSNAVYMGDYCRTGVNSMIMPGCKIGTSSVIGPGVLIDRDIEDKSYVQLKQELVIKKWDIGKYGW